MCYFCYMQGAALSMTECLTMTPSHLSSGVVQSTGITAPLCTMEIWSTDAVECYDELWKWQMDCTIFKELRMTFWISLSPKPLQQIANHNSKKEAEIMAAILTTLTCQLHESYFREDLYRIELCALSVLLLLLEGRVCLFVCVMWRSIKTKAFKTCRPTMLQSTLQPYPIPFRQWHRILFHFCSGIGPL